MNAAAVHGRVIYIQLECVRMFTYAPAVRVLLTYLDGVYLFKV